MTPKGIMTDRLRTTGLEQRREEDTQEGCATGEGVLPEMLPSGLPSSIPSSLPSWLGAGTSGSHRDDSQNVLARAGRVVGPQETLVVLIQLLLVRLFLVLGPCGRRNLLRNPDQPVL